MNRLRILANQKILYVVLGFGVAVLIVLNFWGWFFIRNLESQILNQLKIQVKQTGMISTRLIAGEEIEGLYPGAELSPPALYYQQLLWEIKKSGDLENIFILSLDKRLLVDYKVNFKIGDNIPFPVNDSLFRKASLGEYPEPEFSELAGDFFLTSYSPVFNDVGEVAAILVIESPAQFFSTLHYFRNGLFYLGLGGLSVILVFAGLILFAVRQIFSTERQLQENRRLAQLGQMAAMVAHEIRNPLSIIKGSADVLQKKYAHQKDELFDFIPEEIDRLNRLVNEFLQFARRRDLQIEPVPAEELVAQIAAQFNDARIQLKLDADVHTVPMDRDAFKQILINIVENARHAVAEEGKIVISSRVEKGRPVTWMLQVSDNGKGMDEETRARIFDPFFSTKASGSGLGLTITRQLVEQMQGTIQVDSKPNSGTTITIRLPL